MFQSAASSGDFLPPLSRGLQRHAGFYATLRLEGAARLQPIDTQKIEAQTSGVRPSSDVALLWDDEDDVLSGRRKWTRSGSSQSAAVNYSRLRAVQAEMSARRGLAMWHGVRIPEPTAYRDVTPGFQQSIAAQGQNISKVPKSPQAKIAPKVSGPPGGGGGSDWGRYKSPGRPDNRLMSHAVYMAAGRKWDEPGF